MPQTTYGHHYEVRTVFVTVDGAGAGTLAVVFEAGLFAATPNVYVSKHPSNAGTFTFEPAAPAPTKNGFTLKVTGSNLVSQAIPVTFAALAKE